MLRDFSSLNPEAVSPLRGWRKTIEQNQFACWADLKRSLNSVDKVDDLTVFNIGGNKYRLIAYVSFERQVVYVKAVLTHRQYDLGKWRT